MGSEDYFSPENCQIKESIESLVENKAVVKKVGNPNRILVDDADLLGRILGVKPELPKKAEEPVKKAEVPAK